MKKIILSIVIGTTFTILALSLNSYFYNTQSSNVVFLLVLSIAILITPVITSLIASIGQKQFNEITAGSVSATITGIITLLPFYIFLNSNSMTTFIDSSSAWNNELDKAMVSVNLNITPSSLIAQVIYWAVAGTIIGAIVLLVNRRKKGREANV